MKAGDLVRYNHPDDRKEHGDPIGIVIWRGMPHRQTHPRYFGRDTGVLWQGRTGVEGPIDAWALEVLNESR